MEAKNQTPPDLPLSGEEAQSLPPDKGGLRGVGFLRYNKKLTALARENRKNPTAAEIKMWNEVLRMRQFAHHKFLRQKPIADFIVDFYCSELHLVIEIDGDTHGETNTYDLERTKLLNARGLTVIRYTNEDVLGNIAGVYHDLAFQIPQNIPK
jgi:very-short-patch-repair endonuclease